MADNNNLLFKSIKRGNKKAFDKLFKLFYKPLYFFALKFVKSPDLANDIVQEVFVNLWNKADSIKIETTLNSYLFTSVRNRSINLLNAEKSRESYEKQFDSGENSENQNEEESMYRKKIIDESISRLPQKCRDIFIMSKKEGLTYEEISVYLNVSVKTVENQMGIALKKLREDLRVIKNEGF